MELNLDNLPKKGESVLFSHRGATFQMVIENARIRYGQIDVLLSPIAGQGSFWVRYDGLSSSKTAETVNKNAEVDVFDGNGQLVK